ncbi:MAG: hypothetical protein U0984_12225 [Prosthecobacter sp.]|nr:hypothetical protein [Prosthecobacter sp.]
MKQALLRWELWRVPFNLVLLGFGLLWSWPLRETMIDEALLGYLGSVAAFGFTANVFYTLGPAAEAYAFAFRGRGFGAWRWALFGLGLLISLGLTYAFVWTMEILYIALYPSRG